MDRKQNRGQRGSESTKAFSERWSASKKYLRILGKDVVGMQETVCDKVNALFLEVLVEEGHVTAFAHAVNVAQKICLWCRWGGAAAAAGVSGAAQGGLQSRNAARSRSNTGHGCRL